MALLAVLLLQAVVGQVILDDVDLVQVPIDAVKEQLLREAREQLKRQGIADVQDEPHGTEDTHVEEKAVVMVVAETDAAKAPESPLGAEVMPPKKSLEPVQDAVSTPAQHQGKVAVKDVVTATVNGPAKTLAAPSHSTTDSSKKSLRKLQQEKEEKKKQLAKQKLTEKLAKEKTLREEKQKQFKETKAKAVVLQRDTKAAELRERLEKLQKKKAELDRHQSAKLAAEAETAKKKQVASEQRQMEAEERAKEKSSSSQKRAMEKAAKEEQKVNAIASARKEAKLAREKMLREEEHALLKERRGGA